MFLDWLKEGMDGGIISVITEKLNEYAQKRLEEIKEQLLNIRKG